MAPLREALGQPDRRTWRRFLAPARRHRAAADSTPPERQRLLIPASDVVPDGVDADGDRAVGSEPVWRLQPWQLGAGVLMLAAGAVVGTGLLPVARPQEAVDTARPPELGPAPSPDDADPAPAPATTGVRVWPAERVEVTGREVRTDEGRWEVGIEDDVVTIGDWDCDRLPTPAVLRPADGRVAVFDHWASADREEPARTIATVAGAIGLHPGRTCGEVIVQHGDGSREVIVTQRGPVRAGS